MKVHPVNTLIAVVVSILIVYGIFTIEGSAYKEHIAIGGFIFMVSTLVTAIGIRFTNGRKGSNIKLISIIFFVLELFLLYFAISISIYCSTSKEERIVNFVLATIFTAPYILVKITFDPCTKEYLKNGLSNI
jgi:hypothetical protein